MTSNKKAPAFSLKDQSGKTHKLTDYKGEWLLLYFYPRDFTPGCTVEACTLRDNFEDYKKLDIAILGVSTDDANRHDKFAQKHNLPFPLLADVEKKAAIAYNVLRERKIFGRSILGVKRMSFLINPKGQIVKTYENVKPNGHALEVLADFAILSSPK